MQGARVLRRCTRALVSSELPLCSQWRRVSTRYSPSLEDKFSKRAGSLLTTTEAPVHESQSPPAGSFGLQRQINGDADAARQAAGRQKDEAATVTHKFPEPAIDSPTVRLDAIEQRSLGSTAESSSLTRLREQSPLSKSLAERLFPAYDAPLNGQKDIIRREVPQLSEPLQTGHKAPPSTRPKHATYRDKDKTDRWPDLDQTSGPSPVLRIEAVSKTLTITDFRRIIPQGKHIEGWTLDQGDILEVIPGRRLDTLSAETFYFLVFATSESARAYYEHANLVHQVAQQYTPDALHLSSQLLPPGIMSQGMDAAAVVQSYTLAGPGSRLFLRLLNFPLSTWVKLFVKEGGLPWIKHRPDRHPFELRLTLEGPELSAPELRQVFRASGEDRALPWSGGADYDLSVVKWEVTRDVDKRIIAPSSVDQETLHVPRPDSHIPSEAVYIVGFETEHAARSFRAYWHCRAIERPGDSQSSEEEGDEHPAVVQLEFLW